jgi:hypothetical protein
MGLKDVVSLRLSIVGIPTIEVIVSLEQIISSYSLKHFLARWNMLNLVLRLNWEIVQLLININGLSLFITLARYLQLRPLSISHRSRSLWQLFLLTLKLLILLSYRLHIIIVQDICRHIFRGDLRVFEVLSHLSKTSPDALQLWKSRQVIQLPKILVISDITEHLTSSDRRLIGSGVPGFTLLPHIYRVQVNSSWT